MDTLKDTYSKNIGRIKACERCGVEFKPTSNRSKWCSPECKMGARNCKQCGIKFVPKKNTKMLFCSKGCHYEFKVPTGSVIPHGDGYMIIKVPNGEPGAGTLKGRKRWMFEHRYVMQKKLGRNLEPYEKVHHVNGVRDDNRPENLELWKTKGHPSGVKDGQYHCAGCRCHE